MHHQPHRHGVLLVSLSVFYLLISPSHQLNITFGQSAALTGSSALLGVEFEKGLRAAFHESNTKGLIAFNQDLFNFTSSYNNTNNNDDDETCVTVERVNLLLKTLDDRYEPLPARTNTKALLEDYDVFALIGEVGTPTSVAALDYINNEYMMMATMEVDREVPFIGAMTGAMQLRQPYDRKVVNIRASYNDETASMIEYLTNQRGISRISIFYQNDSFGVAGLNGLLLAMNASGLSLESYGTYERNTMDIYQGLRNITKGHPEAIVMIGTYSPLALFVYEAKRSASLSNGLDVLFLTVSFVGSEAFRDNLATYAPLFSVQFNGSSNIFDNTLITQVVPLPTNKESSLIRNYHKSMKSLNDSFDPFVSSSFLSLEGYLVGRFVSLALQRIQGPITRQAFLDVIYNTSIFNIDDIRLGPYGPECSQPFLGCSCNQGMHQVYMTYISQDGNFTENSGALHSFLTCGTPRPLFSPVVFGQVFSSQDDWLASMGMRQGVTAAYQEFNALGKYPREVRLIAMQDAFQTSRETTLELINHFNVLGLIGSGTNLQDVEDEASLSSLYSFPFLGASSPSMSLRSPFNESVINLIPSVQDQAAAAVAFALNEKGISRFGIVYEDTPLGRQGWMGYSLSLRKLGHTSSFNLSTTTASPFILPSQLYDRDGDQFCILVAVQDEKKIVEVVKVIQEHQQGVVLIGLDLSSQFDAVMKNMLSSIPAITTANNVYFTQPFPLYTDTSYDIVNEYNAAMQKAFPQGYVDSFDAFEGYIIGKFAVSVIPRVDGVVTRKSFIDAVYVGGVFGVGSALTFGPFASLATPAPCNAGARQVNIMKMNITSNMYDSVPYVYHLDVCGVSYPGPRPLSLEVVSFNYVVGFGVFAGIGILLVVGVFFLSLYLRRRKVADIRTQFFTGALCVGAILLYCSIFVEGYHVSTLESIPSQCSASLFLLASGYILGFAPLFAINVAAFRGFMRGDPPKANLIKQQEMIMIVGGALILTFFLLGVAYVLTPPYIEIKAYGDGSALYRSCTSHTNHTWFLMFVIYFGILMLVNLFLCIRTRNFATRHNSRLIHYASYNIILTAALFLPLRTAFESPTKTFIVDSVGILWGITFTISLTLVYPFWVASMLYIKIRLEWIKEAMPQIESSSASGNSSSSLSMSGSSSNNHHHRNKSHKNKNGSGSKSSLSHSASSSSHSDPSSTTTNSTPASISSIEIEMVSSP
eukprot:TRINITY_DN3126_c0_g1_i3.p1 TRINITY_DN3126_c0_g1~~TRINITY_DN3126_c0_g1_i3.p1  ORF type:complete len:1211 (+),score=227.81 TRINITY_DN3126_c0_g1_i3:56-3688(+)